jgi:dTDP-glucose pyrophosphorylase
MSNWRNFTVLEETSILESLKIIDSAGTQFLMVTNQHDKLLGVVTDGDVRRGILKDIPLSSSITSIMNRKPRTLPQSTKRREALEFLHSNCITHVPIVDSNGIVKEVISLSDEDLSLTRQSTAVLMVGGLGSRLGHLTSNCPKPMLQVGGKPVLENIVMELKSHSFNDFVFCVNYKAEMIQDHFQDGSQLGVKIRYVHETKRMGTAGALSLIPQDIKGPLLVMNGDIITRVNFSGLMDFHKEHNSHATMAVRKYEFQIPFGVVKTENGKIQGIEEKPSHSFLVAAGIYVVDYECLKYIPNNEFYDMPQLFNSMIGAGEVTQAFPIHEYWLDIGREDDLNRAHLEYTAIEKKKPE